MVSSLRINSIPKGKSYTAGNLLEEIDSVSAKTLKFGKTNSLNLSSLEL